MGNDLKKVGLIFKTDGSTDFVKSLKNVNASLQENYQNFRLVQAQYDKNTTTSQKLADKLEYLNGAYDIQKKKVIVLQEELKELVNAENKDEVAITKKKASLAQAEVQLSRYGSQIKDVSNQLKSGTADLKDYAESVSKAGQKVMDAGKKLSVLSAGIVTTGVAAANSAMSLEDASRHYIATTNKSVAETERFENVLKNIHKNNYGSDYGEIASKMSLVTQQLGEMDDVSLQNIVENAYLLEDAFEIDFNEAIRGVTGLIKNMGLTADEAFNYIVVGAQNGLNKSGELGDNLAEYTQIWGQAGFSAQEMFTILENGLNSGAYNLDKVNDFVKEFTISLSDGRIEEHLSSFSSKTRALFRNWQNGGASSKDVFYSIISDLEQMENKQKSLSLASEIWSALGEDNAMDVITSLNDVGNTYTDVANKANEAQDTMYGGPSSKIKTMKRNVQSSLTGLGDSLLTNIMPVLDELANGLEKFTKWFDSLDEDTKQNIVRIGLLIAAIGPLLILFGTITKGVSKIIFSFGKLLRIGKGVGAGLSTVFSFLAANPIVLVIAGISMIVAGLIYLWNTNEGFRNAVAEAWQFIQGLFQEFDEFLTNVFSTDWSNSFGVLGECLNTFFANTSNFYNAFKQILQGIIEFIKGVFTGDWELAWQGIQNIFGGIFNGLLAIAKIPLNGIIGFLNILLDGINSLIRGLNKIQIKMPKWLGGKEFGFNIKEIGKISYMADGGTLLNGAAIVAEAGPELLIQQGNKTKVIPLTNEEKNTKFSNHYRNQIPEENKTVIQNNVTINNNSKYVGPAETARQTRNEIQRMILKWNRRRC